MTGIRRERHRRRWVGVIAGAAALAVGLSPILASSASAAAQAGTQEIAKNGLEKPPAFSGPNVANGGGNSYAWSMAWFNGKLYVGTARHELCVERAIGDYYFPGTGKYKTEPTWHAYCPADKYDMQLQAQIWSYTPALNHWTKVYEAPNVPIPDAALPTADQGKGKVVGRDIGYRGMAILNGALYIAGVTADEYLGGPDYNHFNSTIFSTYPPRILRTTDGKTFTALHSAPSVVQNPAPYGAQKPIGWRSLTVYNGHLYGTVGAAYTGDGQLFRIDNPETVNPTYYQVTPPGQLDVYEVQPYNGQLYIGTANKAGGYGVYRTVNGNDTAWTGVVVFGAGRMSAITSVVSMGVYNGDLYVGASGWYQALFPQSEIIRVHTNDRFDVIAGTARSYTFPGDAAPTNLTPVSGYGDGFNSPYAAHFWRFGQIAGGLYVTTNDWSWNVAHVIGLKGALKNDFGFDVWGTCNGNDWKAVTKQAFGDGLYNFGGRTTQTTPDGKTQYFGSANLAQGFAVWKTGNLLGCTG